MEYRKLGRFTNNVKVLQQELKSIKSQPLEGFIIEGKVIYPLELISEFHRWLTSNSKVQVC